LLLIACDVATTDDEEEDEVDGGTEAPPMGMDQSHPLWVDDEDASACADCSALW
jgi:hypothetical protein